MRIKRRKLLRIINEEVVKELANFEDIQHGEPLSIGEIRFYEDAKQIKGSMNDVWEMLVKSYEPKGGLKSYHSLNHLLKSRAAVKMVTDGEGLLACATYRKTDSSYKMTAIGCDQTPKGKQALQQIVQDDIVSNGIRYWCEASDAVEHYFRKYNGFAIPNSMASEVLGIPEDSITLLDDGVHYERKIGVREPLNCVKAIYGFRNDEVYRRVVSDIEAYSTFLSSVNGMMALSEEADDVTRRMAFVAENLYRMHMEEGFNEFVPSWYAALGKCLSFFGARRQTQTCLTYLRDMEFLSDSVTELRLLPMGVCMSAVHGRVCESEE